MEVGDGLTPRKLTGCGGTKAKSTVQDSFRQTKVRNIGYIFWISNLACAINWITSPDKHIFLWNMV